MKFLSKIIYGLRKLKTINKNSGKIAQIKTKKYSLIIANTYCVIRVPFVHFNFVIKKFIFLKTLTDHRHKWNAYSQARPWLQTNCQLCAIAFTTNQSFIYKFYNDTSKLERETFFFFQFRNVKIDNKILKYYVLLSSFI